MGEAMSDNYEDWEMAAGGYLRTDGNVGCQGCGCIVERRHWAFHEQWHKFIFDLTAEADDE